MRDAALCVDCEILFQASDGVCPKCGSTKGWMLLPVKFVGFTAMVQQGGLEWVKE